MSKTIVDVATQIAEAVMDAIERRNGIIKDDITEAARGVLAKNQSGSSPYLPHMGLMERQPFGKRPGEKVEDALWRWLGKPAEPAVAATGGTVLTIDHVRSALAHFKDMDAAYEAARRDLVAYGSSAVRVNSHGIVEHVDLSPGQVCRHIADDGKIWSLPNGSP